MTREEIISMFKTKPYLLDMGAKKIAYQLKSNVDDVRIARASVRKNTKEFGTTYHPKEVAFKQAENKLPKILIFDIESSPAVSYHFGMHNINLSLDQIIEYPIMLTWAAKWLFSDEVMSDRLTTGEAIRRDDSRIVGSIWELMCEADIVVAHYGDRFDIPMLNSRFIINGFPPPTNFTSIDTKSIASQNFKFISNKLDALAIYFGFAKKLHTDFMLWRRCMEGEESALQEMLTYNKRDVTLLEEVYLKLRPYAKRHPNVGLYIESDEPVCSHCGGDHLAPVSEYYTQTNKYKVYRCSCGALSRVRQSSTSKSSRKNLTVSLGR